MGYDVNHFVLKIDIQLAFEIKVDLINLTLYNHQMSNKPTGCYLLSV